MNVISTPAQGIKYYMYTIKIITYFMDQEVCLLEFKNPPINRRQG